MQVDPVDFEALRLSLNAREGPFELEALVRRVVGFALARGAAVRAYAPGATYRVGERIWYRGQIVDVVAVRELSNPHQGRFAIATLRFPDDTRQRVAMGITGAPQVAEPPNLDGGVVTEVARTLGPEIRGHLLADPAFSALIAESASDSRYCGTSRRVSDRVHIWGRSSGLFCESVLRARLDTASAGDDLEALFSVLKALWDVAQEANIDWGVDVTWRRLIEPALRILGWDPRAFSEGRGYTLFPEPISQYAAIARMRAGTASDDVPLAVLIPVPWGGTFGCSMLSAQGLEGSPLVRLVGRLGGDDGMRWGILTDGRRWRLHGAARGTPDIGSTAAEFYEVDLAEVFQCPMPDGTPSPAGRRALRRWLGLFSVSAFVPDLGERALVDELARKSSECAESAVRRLRKALLSSVIPEIVANFASDWPVESGAQQGMDVDRAEVVRATLGLLHRVLFFLYAEARGLLPLHNPDYYAHSVTSMLHWAVTAVEEARPLSTSTTVTPQYQALLRLFRALGEGECTLGLPDHGAGPFSAVNLEISLLERYRLSDQSVARMLSTLGRPQGEPVEYAALSWRHLCAVIEGVLGELGAAVNMTLGAMASGRVVESAPARRRKAVPGYVGMSAVESPLVGLMTRRAEAFETAMDRVSVLRRQLEEPGSGEQRLALQAAIQAAEAEAREALLGVKVLDPAMRTGVFLVAAVDVLVDAVMTVLADYHRTHPWVRWQWDPVYREIVEIRDQIVARAALPGESGSSPGPDDASILGRLIVTRCLYGADMDLVAVILGRMGLTLRAFIVGAPFISLDTHIRRGNSLIGLRLVDLMDTISNGTTVVEDLRARLAVLGSPVDQSDEVQEILALYETLLDLVLLQRRGDQAAAAMLRRLGGRVIEVLRDERAPSVAEDALVIERARVLRAEECPLHWDIAFTDVFFGDGWQSVAADGGFDAVIGSLSAPAVVGGLPAYVTGDTHASAIGGGGAMAFVTAARHLVRGRGGRVSFVVVPSTMIGWTGGGSH